MGQDFCNIYITSLSKFKSKEQSCFAEKMNIMNIQRLQDRLNALVKYIEDNDLNQYIKKGVSLLDILLARQNLRSFLVYNR